MFAKLTSLTLKRGNINPWECLEIFDHVRMPLMGSEVDNFLKFDQNIKCSGIH